MQAAALASSLGFALVGGLVTGGWKRHVATYEVLRT